MQPINFGNNQARFNYINDRFKKTVELVMEKVAAHLEDPALYPLPADIHSAEHAIHDLVSAIPDHRRKKFIDRHHDNIHASAAKRNQLYGDLAAINLHSNTAIGEQVKTLTVPDDKKITKEAADDMLKIFREHNKTNQGYSTGKKTGYSTGKKPLATATPRAAGLANRFSVFADTLTCNKNSEVGKDEISMAGFAIDAFGGQQDKAAFFVGKFKKGETIPLGANAKLFDLNLDVLASGSGFPQTLSLTLFLVEADLIHNQELSDKLVKAALVLWGIFETISIGIIVTGILGGPVTVLMALIAVFISLSFLEIAIKLIPMITDDFSSAATDVLVVDAQPPVGETVNRTLHFLLNNAATDLSVGDYTAAIRWESIL